jgi:hypothetical protein
MIVCIALSQMFLLIGNEPLTMLMEGFLSLAALIIEVAFGLPSGLGRQCNLGCANLVDWSRRLC